MCEEQDPDVPTAAELEQLKAEFLAGRSGLDDRQRGFLRAGLQAFLDRLGADAWNARRERVLDALRSRPVGRQLAEASSVRVRDDEIAWYLFLCQQTLEDPMCLDVSQAQRAVPFIASIGARWQHAHKVNGLDRKLDELLHKYRKEPDGALFEILVALAYAEAGWKVTLIEEGPQKTPDMRVQRGAQEFFVECKRMMRTTQYAETERTQFLRQWDAAKHRLLTNDQWIWLQGDFHVELADLPAGFLDEVFRAGLPLRHPQGQVLHQSEMATIRARLIDRVAVERHFDENYVKANSPMLARVLGGDWAPENATTTIIHSAKVVHVAWCDVPVLGAYLDQLWFACGFTRQVDAETAIEKKAKDITTLLSRAVEQVPADRPSIIHIAAETMDGPAIERRRTEKVMERIPQFTTEKPVVAVRFHRFMGNQRAELAFEMDETIDKFQADGVDLSALPTSVVVPFGTELRDGSHWNLYS